MCSPPPGGGGLRAYAAPFGYWLSANTPNNWPPAGGGARLCAHRRPVGAVCAHTLRRLAIGFQPIRQTMCPPPIPPQGGATAHTPIPNFATHNALRSTKFAKHKIQLFALRVEIYAKRNGKHNTTRKDMSCMFGVDSHGRKTVSILR